MTKAPVLDERPHFAAAKARITLVHAQLGADTFNFGEVPGLLGPTGKANPGTTPAEYALLQVERAFLSSAKQTHSTRSAWRLSVRGVGATSNEAKWVMAQVAAAFESATLTISGFTSTPLQHDVSDPVAEDGPVFSGFTAYTYVL